MLDFFQPLLYNTTMIKTLARTLHKGSLMQTVIEITADENAAALCINGYPYELIPEELPDIRALQILLRDERVEVYLEVIDMLKEMTK